MRTVIVCYETAQCSRLIVAHKRGLLLAHCPTDLFFSVNVKLYSKFGQEQWKMLVKMSSIDGIGMNSWMWLMFSQYDWLLASYYHLSVLPSVMLCTVAKRYIQQNKWIGSALRNIISQVSALHLTYPLKLLTLWTTGTGTIWCIH